METCNAPNCERPIKGRSLCFMHYQRLIRSAQKGEVVLDKLPPPPGRRRVLGNCVECSLPAAIRERCRNCYARWLRNVGNPESRCSVDACGRSRYSRGLCTAHYQRLRQYGTPTYERHRPPVEERFWERVNKEGPNGCWLWTGARSPQNYGVFSGSRDFGSTSAHRISYMLVTGNIPEGWTIDHLCVNPPCVNPAHLEAVTQGENTRRAWRRIIAKESEAHPNLPPNCVGLLSE